MKLEYNNQSIRIKARSDKDRIIKLKVYVDQLYDCDDEFKSSIFEWVLDSKFKYVINTIEDNEELVIKVPRDESIKKLLKLYIKSKLYYDKKVKFMIMSGIYVAETVILPFNITESFQYNDIELEREFNIEPVGMDMKPIYETFSKFRLNRGGKSFLDLSDFSGKKFTINNKKNKEK